MDYRYRTDEEMKDSGIEWIGKIPYSWIKSKIKYTSDDEHKSFTDGDWIESPYISDSGVRLIQTGNIGIGIYKEQGYRYISEKTFKKLNCTEIKPNDVLICRLAAPVGRACLAPNLNEKMVTSVDVCILKTNRFIDNRYIVYFLSCNGHIETAEMIARGGTRQRISRTQLGDMRFILPTLEEQEKIAKFLDEKTAQFDSIISKKEALIEKLKEAKKSLISEVVTGKVKVVKSSDGYELVERKKEEMKDSGVEWLGDIPKEWELTKLKYNLSKIGSGKTPKGGSEVYTDSGVVFIRSQNVYDDGLRLDDVVFITSEVDIEMKNSSVKFNDVLLNITGGSIGRSSIVDKKDLKANVNQHVCILRPILEEINPKLLHSIIQSNLTQIQIESLQNGSNREGLNFEQIANILIVKSNDMDKQNEIVEYIKVITDNLYKTINKTKKQIEILKEAKQSLISEAVTGKIEIL